MRIEYTLKNGKKASIGYVSEELPGADPRAIIDAFALDGYRMEDAIEKSIVVIDDEQETTDDIES